MKVMIAFAITVAFICNGCGLTASQWKAIGRDGVSAAADYYEAEASRLKAKQQHELLLLQSELLLLQIAASLSAETVYITKTGSKYHRSWCQYLYSSRIPVSKLAA